MVDVGQKEAEKVDDWLSHKADLPPAKHLFEQELAQLYHFPFIDVCHGCRKNIGVMRIFNHLNPHPDECFWSCQECYQELLKP